MFANQGIILSRARLSNNIFGIIGDSNADGYGATIPTVPGGTLYNFNGSSFDEITTQTVSGTAGKGSIWQQFAIDYKAAYGNPVFLVNGASFGSEFYPAGDNNNWYTSGTCYDAFKTKMNSALSNRNTSRPQAIFINLGINDYNSANTISDILIGIDSLFSRLATDFPLTPVAIIQIGANSDSDTANDDRAYAMRLALVNKVEQYNNVHMAASAAFFNGIAGSYQSVHYSQAMNNKLGSQFSMWVTCSDIGNKWARFAVSSHHTALSELRKALIGNCITNLYNAGTFLNLEYLNNFVTSDVNNLCNDFTGLGFAVPQASLSFSANNHMITTGVTASNLLIGYLPTRYLGRCSQTDVMMGTKLKANSSIGTTVSLMCTRSSTFQSRILQSTVAAAYCMNSPIATTRTDPGADNGLIANTLHSAAYNGTNIMRFKNATQVDSLAQASSGLSARAVRIGVNDQNGSLGGALNGTQEYAYVGKYSGINLTTLYNEMEYVVAHWND